MKSLSWCLEELQELWFMNVYHTCNYIHGNLKIILYLGWAYSADFGDVLGIVRGVQPRQQPQCLRTWRVISTEKPTARQ